MDTTSTELLAENSQLRDRIRTLEKSLIDLRGIIETNIPHAVHSDAMRAANELLWGNSWAPQRERTSSLHKED